MDGFKSYFEECCCNGAISSEQVIRDKWKWASGKAGNRRLGSEQESGSVIPPMH